MRGSHRNISTRQLWRTTKQKLFGSSRKSMDPHSKKTAILGLFLLIVFVVVLIFALGSGPASVKAAVNKKDSEIPQMRGSRETTETWTQPKTYSISSRDPTSITAGSPAVTRGISVNALTVSGIVCSSKKSSAIIANQVVFEGDIVEGTKIIKIEKESVEFEKDGKHWRQQVKE
jgi:type II secretory pathway component PulC